MLIPEDPWYDFEDNIGYILFVVFDFELLKKNNNLELVSKSVDA